ncbi:hypothetical protein [uncultured Psychroserpens sp.]|uniref:hypothetical protein n=1 Tax=uncultured Psychroserpens sp. TaxID=255436 RepID=UPI002627AA10|nr:hypothetical protein [uncultured Psychroserpens sp.]
MEVLIFQTDIETKTKVKSIRSSFNNHSGILKWSIDIEDIDNVLRIEAVSHSLQNDIINLANTRGFNIKLLPD